MKKDTPKNNTTVVDIRLKESTHDSFVRLLFVDKYDFSSTSVARFERIADDCADYDDEFGHALSVPLLKWAERYLYAIKSCMRPKDPHKATLISINAQYRIEQVIKSLKESVAVNRPDEIRVNGGIIQID